MDLRGDQPVRDLGEVLLEQRRQLLELRPEGLLDEGARDIDDHGGAALAIASIGSQAVAAAQRAEDLHRPGVVELELPWHGRVLLLEFLETQEDALAGRAGSISFTGCSGTGEERFDAAEFFPEVRLVHGAGRGRRPV